MDVHVCVTPNVNVPRVHQLLLLHIEFTSRLGSRKKTVMFGKLVQLRISFYHAMQKTCTPIQMTLLTTVTLPEHENECLR